MVAVQVENLDVSCFCVTNGNRGWSLWYVIKVSARRVRTPRESKFDSIRSADFFQLEWLGFSPTSFRRKIRWRYDSRGCRTLYPCHLSTLIFFFFFFFERVYRKRVWFCQRSYELIFERQLTLSRVNASVSSILIKNALPVRNQENETKHQTKHREMTPEKLRNIDRTSSEQDTKCAK